MPDPSTALDERFSEPDADATSWAETKRLIEDAQLFWLTTVRADGRPHCTPLVAVWLDDAVHFCTGPDEQKAVNLRANRHVLLTTGCNDWRSGVDVMIEGDAEPVTDEATLTRLAAAWREKWDGDWEYSVEDEAFALEGGRALVFSVAPTKVLAFGKGPYTHTSHRFGGG